MAKPTAPELELISRFRQRLQDLNLEPEALVDHELLRWIRARNHDLSKAEQMLRKSVQWRVDNGYENLAKWTPPDLVREKWPIYPGGFDTENSPIVLAYTCNADLTTLYKSGLKNDVIAYIGHQLESAIERSKGKLTPEGYPVTQVVVISDIQNIPMSTVLSPAYASTMLDGLRCVEANYPERIKKMVFINAGTAFATLYKLARPLISDATARKIGVCNEDVHKFRQSFLPNISPESICPRWGGTKVCPFDFCCSKE